MVHYLCAASGQTQLRLSVLFHFRCIYDAMFFSFYDLFSSYFYLFRVRSGEVHLRLLKCCLKPKGLNTQYMYFPMALSSLKSKSKY